VMISAQPQLATARLILRPAVSADVDALHELWSAAEVRRFLFDDEDVSRELAKTVLDGCLANASQGLGLWMVLNANDQSLLGCAGLNPVTVAAEYEPALLGLIEPVAAFAPRYWGKGYADESLRALLGHAFGPLAQTSVAAVNDVPNAASERMLLKLGFTRLSEVQGPRHRLRTYQLSRADWLSAALATPRRAP
jgi:[ribosomal protein S5]-alanine N-acetyltransferase